MSDIKNRLTKNIAKVGPWAQKLGIGAYRIYDRDIPEYPYIADRYGNNLVIYDRGDKVIDGVEKKRDHWSEFLLGLAELTGISEENFAIKQRVRQKGTEQYQKISHQGHRQIVSEGPAKFEVNLFDYLDTGLFLDHRLMRKLIFDNSSGKRFLNLFSYTASVTVYAALGGAVRSVSVDMSKTYTNWAQRNLSLNGINEKQHKLVCADVIQWLDDPVNTKEKYDLIFLDPPTFSNSKKMPSSFEIEREQIFLVDSCVRLLEPKGLLYFSTNKRGFKLAPELQKKYGVKDISKKTIPKDFRDQKVHQVFEISATESN